MVLPEVIQIPQSPAIATFNFSELITRQGIITLQGYDINDASGSNEERLGENQEYSFAVSNSNTFSTDGTKDLGDYDLIFQRPIIVDGLMRCIVPIKHTPASRNYNSTTQIVVKHVDLSATETTLLTLTSTDDFITATTRQLNVMEGEPTRQLFKIGEKLRISIDVTISSIAGSGNAVAECYHDPTNTAEGDFQTTQLKFNIPILLRL